MARLASRSSFFRVRHGRRAHRHVSRITGGVPAARPPRARFGWRAGSARLRWRHNRVRVRSLSRPALFWRVAIGNAAVLAAACTITALVFSPAASRCRLRELAIFVGGLALMLALNLLLLRRALAPLRELTAFARRIDPLPGRRLEVGGGDSEAASGGGLQRTARSPRGRAARQRRPRARGPGGRAVRVAQELHDGVGQTLTGVVLQLGRVARDVPDPCATASWRPGDRPRQPRGSARIARRLRPEALDDLGLASALLVLGDRVAEHSGLAVDVFVQPGLPEFSAEGRLVLYRVAQEALTNVARHARRPARRGAARAVRRASRGWRSTTTARASRAGGARGRRRARHARARGADRRRR